MQFQHMPSSKNFDTQSCQAGNTFLFLWMEECGEGWRKKSKDFAFYLQMMKSVVSCQSL